MRVVLEADGGSRGNPGPAGYGAVVRDAGDGQVLAERAESIGRATNNVAEYRGLLAALSAAAELGVDPADVEVEARMDSKLVVEQMSGRWQVKHPDLKPLARQAGALASRFARVRYRWIPRAQNSHADRLANEAMDAAAVGRAWSASASTAELSAPPYDATRSPYEATGSPSGAAGAAAVGASPVPARVPGSGVGWRDPVGPPTTLLLLRHGETALSVDKRFSGTGDPPLTPRGQAQADAAARRLADARVDAVVSSPLRRARQTGAAVGDALGLAVEVDEGLRETDFGEWEGHTFAEVRQGWPAELEAWLASPDVAPPGGESFAATTTRVQAARDRLLAAHPGRRVVVVSHVSPIKTLVRLALEAGPATLYRLHLDLACLTEVQHFADGPAVLRSLNDTGHLVGELAI